jgi:hypothetical protein
MGGLLKNFSESRSRAGKEAVHTTRRPEEPEQRKQQKFSFSQLVNYSSGEIMRCRLEKVKARFKADVDIGRALGTKKPCKASKLLCSGKLWTAAQPACRAGR